MSNDMEPNTGKESSAHTPGPWTVEQSFDDARAIIVTQIAERGDAIETMDTEDDATQDATAAWDEEYAANLALIAAAPDLLTALERAVTIGSETCIDCGRGHDPEDHIPWIAQARAAIARARASSA